jgi:hypothetical protein
MSRKLEALVFLGSCAWVLVIALVIKILVS